MTFCLAPTLIGLVAFFTLYRYRPLALPDIFMKHIAKKTYWKQDLFLPPKRTIKLYPLEIGHGPWKWPFPKGQSSLPTIILQNYLKLRWCSHSFPTFLSGAKRRFGNHLSDFHSSRLALLTITPSSDVTLTTKPTVCHQQECLSSPGKYDQFMVNVPRFLSLPEWSEN